jgi:hypothetical protein
VAISKKREKGRESTDFQTGKHILHFHPWYDLAFRAGISVPYVYCHFNSSGED